MSYYIIIRGPLGIGKTTIAKKLAEKLHAQYLSIDEIVDAKDFRKTKASDGFISEESFVRANERIIPKVKEYLDEGTPVIIDGNFYRKNALLDLLKRLKYEHYVFTLQAPLEVCIERDKKRKKPLGKDAARVVYNKTCEFDYGIIIETEKLDVEKTLRKILRELPKSK